MISRDLKKLLINFSIGLSVVVVLVWGLLITPIFANNLQVIQIRNGYEKIFEKVWKWSNLPDMDNYRFLHSSLRVLSKNEMENEYTYSFRGRIEKIDVEQKILYFRSSNGRLFGFHEVMENDSLYGSEWVEMSETQKTESGQIIKSHFIFNYVDLSKSGDRDDAFETTHVYTVIWRDQRSMMEIIKVNGWNNLKSINDSAEQILFVIR